MSKRVRLVGNSLGQDLTTVSIYHTSVTASNLLTASLTASALPFGVEFIVDDTATVFIARADDGKCLNYSASFEIASTAGNTRVFTVTSNTSGSVEATAPIVVPATSGSFVQAVNYDIYSTFTIEAAPTYPFTFDGWYDSISGGTQVSTTNPLSIGENDFTSSFSLDKIYAQFS